MVCLHISLDACADGEPEDDDVQPPDETDEAEKDGT